CRTRTRTPSATPTRSRPRCCSCTCAIACCRTSCRQSTFDERRNRDRDEHEHQRLHCDDVAHVRQHGRDCCRHVQDEQQRQSHRVAAIPRKRQSDDEQQSIRGGRGRSQRVDIATSAELLRRLTVIA